MSRYRKTMREALEEIRGKVEEQQNLKEDGHTDVVSAKRQCSTIMEDARDISNKLGSLSPEDGLPSWWMNKLAVSSNSMNKLRDFFIHSEARQLKDPKKEMMVVKDGKVKVIDKSDWDKYKAKGYDMAEELEEGKMKDIFSMQQDGASVKDIAKKMGLDVQTVKDILGEEIALEKVERVPTGQYIVSYKTQDGTRKARVFDYRQHAHDFEKKLKSYGLKSEEDLKEFNPDFGKDASASRTQTSGEKDKVIKDDKDKDKEIQSLKNDIAMLKTKLENEKNKAVKPEPNPKTGEVPLTVGVAYKHFKDKEEKVKTEEVELNEKDEFHLFDNKKDAEKKAKEIGGKVIDGTNFRAGYYAVYKGKSVKEELEEATFSRAMISQLKKAYGNLKTITPANATKLNKILDTVTKDGLIDLYKAKIPFVSIGAGGKLSQKHNLSPMDIKRIISKEEVQEEVELTEYFATVHSDKKQIADFIKKNKSGIDYVDDDAGGNIEFEGKNAHELADKVKAKFGVRVTKESFEPIEDKSLDEKVNMNVPMTVQYTYGRNPISFMQTLVGTKAGKKLKSVFPIKKGSGVYTLKGTGQDHIDFLKVLNNKGIMPKNKILGEEQKFEGARNLVNKILGERK
jgi:hypothetical protein